MKSYKITIIKKIAQAGAWEIAGAGVGTRIGAGAGAEDILCRAAAIQRLSTAYCGICFNISFQIKGTI